MQTDRDSSRERAVISESYSHDLRHLGTESPKHIFKLGTDIACISGGLLFLMRGAVYLNFLRRKVKGSPTLSKRHTGERGAVIVETMLALPVLALFVFGAVQVGLALEERAVLEEVSRVAVKTAELAGQIQSLDTGLPTDTSIQDIRTLIDERLAGANLGGLYRVTLVGPPGGQLEIDIVREHDVGFYLLVKPRVNVVARVVVL